jgi:hypothetical protein
MRGTSMVPGGRWAAGTLVLVFLMVAGIAALTPAPAEAQTRCGTEFQYYSDATYTELVGIRGWLPYESCGCQSYGFGDFTAYKIVLDSYC